MPIRPIELIQTQNAAPVKHVEQTKVPHEQVQINKSFQESIAHQQKKTVQADKSENKEFRYDAKEKGNGQFLNSSQHKQQKKKEQEKDDNRRNPVKGGGLDIKI